MADLDDFFAKKDRKKSKTTKKFATADEIAKKLEDNAKKTSEKSKKDRAPAVAEGDESTTPVHDQDEWKDFEEEKKDYSGLKIGNLAIGSQADGTATATDAAGNNVEQQQGGYDDQGTDGGDKKVAGPWKRIDIEVQEAPEPPKVEVVRKMEAPQIKLTAGGAYVPPSMRGQSQQPQSGGGQQPSRLRSKVAPDIHNEEFFPTLSKGDHKKGRNEGSFEVVQHNRAGSHRHVEQTKMSSAAGQGPKLTLGNRYNTLSDS